MLIHRILILSLILSCFIHLHTFDYVSGQAPTQQIQASSKKPAVMIDVLVTDAQNRPVSDLSQDDFQIIEEGVSQTISLFLKHEVAINYVLAIDISGSLKDRISEITTAAKILVNGNKSSDETFLIAFRERVEALTDGFTSDKASLFAELNGLPRWAGGQTALNDAIYLALDPLADHRKLHPDTNRRYALVLISDGSGRVSYYKEKDVLKRLRKEGIKVFVIGLSNYPDKKGNLMSKGERTRATAFLTQLAKETGGQVFFPQSVSDLMNAANDITAYLRTQYVIGYNPSVKATKGSYRKIIVKIVNKPGQEQYTIHSRDGYEVIQD